MKTEILTFADRPNVTLTAYRLDESGEMPNAQIRPAVLVLPGGGYFVCSDREAEPIALVFLARGYHAFALRYSVGAESTFPRPLHDAEAALDLLRANAAAWRLDPDRIAVCGFSAGGHLAAALGTLGRLRPNALVLGYPCILDSMSSVLATPVPSLEKHVDSQTPPTFIFTTANDALVPVANSLAFAAALAQAQVPFELHVFQDGVHGLSLARPHTSSGFAAMNNPRAAVWVELCLDWLDAQFAPFAADLALPAPADQTEPGPAVSSPSP